LSAGTVTHPVSCIWQTQSHQFKNESANSQVMPSLTFSQHKSLQSNCSEKDQLQLRENFLNEAAEIGKAFLRKVD
jgi:hypothetical protein